MSVIETFEKDKIDISYSKIFSQFNRFLALNEIAFRFDERYKDLPLYKIDSDHYVHNADELKSPQIINLKDVIKNFCDMNISAHSSLFYFSQY